MVEWVVLLVSGSVVLQLLQALLPKWLWRIYLRIVSIFPFPAYYEKYIEKNFCEEIKFKIS